MKNNRFGSSDEELNRGKRLYGRVISYSMKDGYGHIKTEDCRDIMLSSYDLKGIEKQIVIGTTVSFFAEKRDNHVVAYCVEIEDNRDFYYVIDLPGDLSLPVKKLEKIDYRDGRCLLKMLKMTEDDIKKDGFDISDLSFLYIKERKGKKYYFFEKMNPYIKGARSFPGVKDFYETLYKKLLSLEIVGN